MGKYLVRKNPRLNGYDYCNPNYYFLTICTHEKKCIFGYPNQLNELGRAAKEGIIQIPVHFKGAAIDKYVVMPNHVHLILVSNQYNYNVSTIVSNYKAFVSRMIHKTGYTGVIWQRSFHDHIIRNETSYHNIWNYIDGNPQKWNEDCFYFPL